MLKVCICTLLLAAASFSSAADRFSGQGGLSPSSTQTSANQRFSVSAALKAAPMIAKISANGRFSVTADLAAPKSALASCGPLTDDIFKNGFEN